MNRSSPRPLPPVPDKIDELLAQRIHQLIQRFPAWGYRRVWAWLKHSEGLHMNKTAVYRIFRLKRWFVNQRKATPRPRVKASRSTAAASNKRWAMDVTHVDCGSDGWGHLAAVIDCCDRQIVGWEFALRARATEAERALEEACLARFGTLRPEGPTPVIRSDNGLIFQSRHFRAACREFASRTNHHGAQRRDGTPQPGVRHALHPRAERHDREVPPQPERGVRMAAVIRQL